MTIKSTLLLLLSIITLSSCAYYEEQNIKANSVYLVTENDVTNCEKLAIIDSSVRYLIENARYDIKVKAYDLNATHVVQSLVYTAALQNDFEFGIGISAIAYKCPLNARQSDNKEALFPYHRQFFPHCDFEHDGFFRH